MKLIKYLGIISLILVMQSECAQTTQDIPPAYLYKIVSREYWDVSKGKTDLILSSDDLNFIHFSTAEQYESIIAKYWSKIPEFLILTINTKKLSGKMVFETNPGGEKKYYHLYNGAIPLAAVVATELRKNNISKNV